MQTKEFCAYNETRENFLSSRVTVIDSKSDPLRGIKALIEGLGSNQEAGLWLNPLKSVPTVPTMSPYDLVYLDQDCRVVDSVAMIPDDEVPHFGGHAASALLLPIHTFSKSQAHPGDQVIICAAEEIERRPARMPVVSLPAPSIPAPAQQSPHSDANPPRSQPDFHSPLLLASSSQPQTAISKATDQVQSPIIKNESSSIRFLRGMVHLRVHISFSIAPIPASKTIGSQSPRSIVKLPPRPGGKLPMKTGAQGTRSLRAGWTEKLTAQSASFKKRIAAFWAKSSRLCARNYKSWKLSYLRWADKLMHPAARIAASPTPAETKRPRVQACSQQRMRARFLRCRGSE